MLSKRQLTEFWKKGYRTPDLCGEGLTKVSTSQMGQLIAAELA